METKEKLKEEILTKIGEYYGEVHKTKEFIPGKTLVHFAGRVFDEKEMKAMADSLLDFFLTFGKHGEEFEKNFAEFLGVRYSVLVNSGSSANLLAVSTLCSHQLEDKKLNPGDEVITPATTFPTTLNPIIQNNLVPVFLDVELDTLNVNPDLIEEAISEKTRAIFIPHTLGNPNDMDKIMDIAKRHNLYVLEDACDALDSTYDGKKMGTFGEMGTVSFYPAHHMTLGEGGAIFTDNPRYKLILKSLRDWGRACWCATGKSNTCGKRFDYTVNNIAYDHKYMYSNIGYNLKPLDLQAAMGVEQLKKLPEFTRKRKENFKRLYARLKKYEDVFILPRAVEKADPSWFCFPLTIKDGSGFSRKELTLFLEEKMIETRLIFAGNIIHQKAYKDINYRKGSELTNSDKIMKDSFFVGVYPGLDDKQMDYIADMFDEFLAKRRKKE